MALDKDTMFEIIKKFEDNKLTPYYDSKGLITIGIGFNIKTNDDDGNNKFRNIVFIDLGIAEIRNGSLEGKILYNEDNTVNTIATTKLATYFEELKNLIKDDTYNGSTRQSQLDAQSAILNTNLNTIMSQIQSDEVLNNYKSNFRTTFTLTQEEVKDIFDDEIDTYTDNVDRFLNSITGSNKLNIPDTSGMYQTLVSLSYNGIELSQAKSPGLRHAIENGNRAEAWFQIRYDTNRHEEAGVSKRRFYESEIFGLFEGTSPTVNEAKDFFKMMRFHEERINEIETLHVSNRDMVAEANRDYGANSVHYLTYFSEEASSILKANYAEGKSIDNVIVGTDTINDNSSNRGTENINDTLVGTANNDLIFGERGDDTISGLGGDDVFYGGAGDDTLIGGEGNDTYVFNIGDGNDTITDTSENDTLVLDGVNFSDININDSNDDIVIHYGDDSVLLKEYGDISNQIYKKVA